MERIFKICLLSVERQWGLLSLNIIPIFYKNNVKKTKIHLMKNIGTAATVFSQSDT